MDQQESSYYMRQVLGTDDSTIESLLSTSLNSSSFKDTSTSLSANNTSGSLFSPSNLLTTTTTPRQRRQRNNPNVTSLIRVLAKDHEDQQSCVFPKVPPSSSSMFDSNTSIDEVLQSPEHEYNNNSSAAAGLMVVKPEAIGKQIRPHVTLETARLVSQVVAAGMEDWVRQYTFCSKIEWKGRMEHVLDTARNLKRTDKQHHVVVVSIGSAQRIVLNQWMHEAYASLNLEGEQQQQNVVTLSVVEICDKHMVDLLLQKSNKGDDAPALKVHHPDKLGGVILNLTQSLIDSSDTCDYLLRQSSSSSSDGIVVATITVWESALDQQLNRLTKCRYLQFVHLPSSQAAAAASSESPSISRSIISLRQSLSSLGALLRQIVAGTTCHLLSFRDCLLTKVLQRSLEPPSTQLVLLGTIAPTVEHYDQTMHTLNYLLHLFGKYYETAESPFDGNNNSTTGTGTPIITSPEMNDLTKHPAFLQSYVSDPRQRLASLEQKKMMKSPSPVSLPIPKKQASSPEKTTNTPLHAEASLPPEASSSYRPTNYMDLDPFDFQSKYYDDFADPSEEKKDAAILLSPITPVVMESPEKDLSSHHGQTSLESSPMMESPKETSYRQSSLQSSSPMMGGSPYLKDVSYRQASSLESSSSPLMESPYPMENSHRQTMSSSPVLESPIMESPYPKESSYRQTSSSSPMESPYSKETSYRQTSSLNSSPYHERSLSSEEQDSFRHRQQQDLSSSSSSSPYEQSLSSAEKESFRHREQQQQQRQDDLDGVYPQQRLNATTPDSVLSLSYERNSSSDDNPPQKHIGSSDTLTYSSHEEHSQQQQHKTTDTEEVVESSLLEERPQETSFTEGESTDSSRRQILQQYPDIEEQVQKLDQLFERPLESPRKKRTHLMETSPLKAPPESPLENYLQNGVANSGETTPRGSLGSQEEPDWFAGEGALLEETDLSKDVTTSTIQEEQLRTEVQQGSSTKKPLRVGAFSDSVGSFESIQEQLKDAPLVLRDGGVRPIRNRRPKPRRTDSKISVFTTDTDEAGGPLITTPSVPSSVNLIPTTRAKSPSRNHHHRRPSTQQRRNRSPRSPRRSRAAARRSKSPPRNNFNGGNAPSHDIFNTSHHHHHNGKAGGGGENNDDCMYELYQLQQAVEEMKGMGSMTWEQKADALECLRKYIIIQRGMNQQTVDQLNAVKGQLRDAEEQYKDKLAHHAEEAGQERLKVEQLQKQLVDAMAENSSFSGVAEQAVSSMEQYQQELNSLRSNLQTAQLESQVHRQKYESAVEMKDKLVEELKEVQTDASNLTMEYNESEADLEFKMKQLVMERNRLREQRERETVKFQQLRLENDELRLESGDVADTTRRLEAKEEEVERLQELNHEYSSRLLEQQRAMSKGTETRDAEIDTLRLEKQTLEMELLSARRRLDDDKGDRQRFRKAIEEEQKALRDKTRQVELERDHLQELRDTDMSELETLKLESALRADLEKRLRAAGGEIDRLRAERSKVHDDMADVRADAAAALDEKDSDMQQLKLELHQARLELTSLKRRLDDADAENERIQNLAEEEHSRTLARLSAANAELERVRGDLAESVRARHETADEASELQVSLQSREESNATLGAELDRVKEEQVSVKNDNKKLRESLYELRDKARAQVTSIAEKKRDNDLMLEAEREKSLALQTENTYLKNSLERVRREKEVEEGGLDNFKEDMNKLMKEKAETQAKFAVLEKELKETELKAEDLEHELKLAKLRSNEDLLHKTKDEYRAVQASNAQLTEERDGAIAERDHATQNIETLRQQIEKLQEAKASAETNAARLESGFEESKGAVEDLQHKLEIANLRSNSDILKKAREENRAYQKMEAELKMHLEQTQIERDHYRQVLEDSKSELKTLTTSKKEVEEQVSALMGKLRITEHNTGELQQESQVSRQKRDEMHSELNATRQQAEVVHLELERIKKRMAEISHERDVTKQDRDQLRQHLKSAKIRSQELSHHLKASHHDKQELSEQIKMMTRKGEELNGQLNLATKKEGELVEELRMTAAKVEDLNEQLKAASRMTEELQEKLQTAVQEGEELRKQLRSETLDREALGQQLQVASQNEEDLIQQIQIASKGKEDIEQQMKRATQRSEDLSQQLHLASESKQESVQRAQLTSQRVDELNRQLQMKTREGNELNQQLQLATRNGDNLSQQLKVASRNREELKSEFATIARDKEELGRQLERVTRSRDELRQELNDMIRKKDEAHHQLENAKQLQEESERARGDRKLADSELQQLRQQVEHLVQEQQDHGRKSDNERAMELEIENLQAQLSNRNGVSLSELRAEQERNDELRQLITTLADRAKASAEQRDRRIWKLNASLVQVSEQKEAEIQALRARLHDWERSVVHDDEEFSPWRSPGGRSHY